MNACLNLALMFFCDRIAKSIDTLKAYSYQFNVKIVDMLATTQNKTSDQTVALCLRLFEALGVEDVSLNDILLIGYRAVLP